MGFNSTATASTGSTGDTAITIALTLGNATAAHGFQCDLQCYVPAGTAISKYFKWSTAYLTNIPALSGSVGAGSFVLNQAAINGLRFLMSAGNITSGVFSLYGIRKV